MERVTQKDELGYYLTGDGIYSDWGTPEKFRGDDVDRLAAYEDTGLEPEEINALCEMDRRAKMAEMLRLEESTGVSIDRLRELAEADREGKIPKYTLCDTVYDRLGMDWKVASIEYVRCAYERKWLYHCGRPETREYSGLYQDELLPTPPKEAALRREQDDN